MTTVERRSSLNPHEPGYCGNLSVVISVVAVIGLTIIGGFAVGERLSSQAAGWLSLSVGGGSSLFFLLTHGKKKISIIAALLITSAFIAIGVLGGLGKLQPHYVGSGIIGLSLSISVAAAGWLFYTHQRKESAAVGVT